MTNINRTVDLLENDIEQFGIAVDKAKQAGVQKLIVALAAITAICALASIVTMLVVW